LLLFRTDANGFWMLVRNASCLSIEVDPVASGCERQRLLLLLLYLHGKCVAAVLQTVIFDDHCFCWYPFWLLRLPLSALPLLVLILLDLLVRIC
jgi:hypothetical protein